MDNADQFASNALEAVEKDPLVIHIDGDNGTESRAEQANAMNGAAAAHQPVPDAQGEQKNDLNGGADHPELHAEQENAEGVTDLPGLEIFGADDPIGLQINGENGSKLRTEQANALDGNDLLGIEFIGVDVPIGSQINGENGTKLRIEQENAVDGNDLPGLETFGAIGLQINGKNSSKLRTEEANDVDDDFEWHGHEALPKPIKCTDNWLMKRENDDISGCLAFELLV